MLVALLLSCKNNVAAQTNFDCDPEDCGHCYFQVSSVAKINGNTFCASIGHACVDVDETNNELNCSVAASSCGGCTAQCNDFMALCAYPECVGDWTEWGGCTPSCGGSGTGTQYRTWELEGRGLTCSYTDGETESQSCSISDCPEDCVGAWTAWSACTDTCGGGTQSREFEEETAPLFGGADCEDVYGASDTDTQTIDCNTQCCDGDADSDGVCTGDDSCPYDADDDIDSDATCGDVDSCPFDPADDADSDDVCGDEDSCPSDPGNDADSDNTCAEDDCCPHDGDNDIDSDAICANDDSCQYDTENDADNDNVCGNDDQCDYDPEDDADADNEASAK